MKRKINGNQPATKKDLKNLDTKLTKRMDGFGKRMDGFGKRMDGFEKRMDTFEREMKDEFSAHKIAIELKLDEQQEKNEASRQEFYSKIFNLIDPVMKEISAMREENVISADMKRQVNNHEARLETVEEKLGIRSLAA